MRVSWVIAALLATAPGAYQAVGLGPEPERVKELFPGRAESQQLALLGWSKDGKLAYAVLDDTGESGLRRFTFVLTDLKTDQQLATVTVTADREEIPATVAMLEGQPEFLAAMKARAIIPAGATRFVTGPPKVKGDALTLALQTTPTAMPDDVGRTGVAKWTLRLSGPGGSKVLAEVPTPEGHYPPLRVGVLGHYQSPHEPRIAVMVGEERAGFEGDTIVLLRVIGAGLTTGFKTR